MSRVALAGLLACCVVVLAGCGSSGSTAHGHDSAPPSSGGAPASATGSSTESAGGSSTAPPGPWAGATAANQFVATVTPFLDAKNTVTADTNVFGGDHLPSKREFPAVWAPVVAHCAAASSAASTAIGSLTEARAKRYWPASALPAISRSIHEIRWYATLMKQCPHMHSTADVVQWFLDTDLKRTNTITATLQKAVDALKLT